MTTEEIGEHILHFLDQEQPDPVRCRIAEITECIGRRLNQYVGQSAPTPEQLATIVAEVETIFCLRGSVHSIASGPDRITVILDMPLVI